MGKTSPPERRELLALLRQQPRGRANQHRERIESLIPVSYTHLTLPTICSV